MNFQNVKYEELFRLVDVKQEYFSAITKRLIRVPIVHY